MDPASSFGDMKHGLLKVEDRGGQKPCVLGALGDLIESQTAAQSARELKIALLTASRNRKSPVCLDVPSGVLSFRSRQMQQKGDPT